MKAILDFFLRSKFSRLILCEGREKKTIVQKSFPQNKNNRMKKINFHYSFFSMFDGFSFLPFYDEQCCWLSGVESNEQPKEKKVTRRKLSQKID